jgi:general secretion pathway protein A
MYLSFFGLNEKPFAITPDPRYLYLSARHAEALAHLLYGVNEAGGFVQLTGEVGTGKTTIIRSLLAQIPKNAEIALILNPRMTAPEFLLTICEELGIGVPDDSTNSLKDLVDILSHYLLRAHSQGKRIVLVVDEAQNLAPDVLEQVRLLTNLETNTQKLLQIILIGQPELRELLARNELRQLAQRITGRYHLDPLSEEETSAYVRHRLRVAGATTDIFTVRALKEVHRLSTGVPRVINVICDRALLGAYTQDKHHVSASLVCRSAAEVFGKRIAPFWLPWAATAATVVVVALAGVGIWQWFANAAAGAPAEQTQESTPQAGSPTQAMAGTLPTSAPAVQTPPPPPPLQSLLAQYVGDTDPDDAFGKLFGLWGAAYVAGKTDPCTQAVSHGLDCFIERGSFAQLRLYNRPAILMLSDDSGTEHQVVLSGLSDDHARLEFGGQTHQVGIAELSRYWFGDFVLLWKPDTRKVKALSPGMRGSAVRRLRQNLQQLQGVEVKQPVSDVYDDELRQLVQNFQREHRLAVDGVADVQTLVVLNSVTSSGDAPSLQPPHGS